MAKAAETEPTKPSRRPTPLQDGFAGCLAGLVSTAVFYPLDLIKTHIQNNVESRASLRTSFQSVYRTFGVRGLYSGLSVNLIGSGSAWGLYFFGYSALKEQMRKAKGTHKLGSQDHFLLANIAGLAVTVVTNPIWVIKTRMQLQSSRAAPGGAAARIPSLHYSSVLDGLRKLCYHEGARGLAKGLSPNLFNGFHGAVHMSLYERLVRWQRQRSARAEDDPLPWRETVACTATAKLGALLTTYPLQVLRTRQHSVNNSLQKAVGEVAADSKAVPGANLLTLTKSIYASEGPTGFYKGLCTASIRTLPATCITFLVYENLRNLFSRH